MNVTISIVCIYLAHFSTGAGIPEPQRLLSRPTNNHRSRWIHCQAVDRFLVPVDAGRGDRIVAGSQSRQRVDVPQVDRFV